MPIVTRFDHNGQPIQPQKPPIEITTNDKEALILYVLDGLRDGTLHCATNHDLYLVDGQNKASGTIIKFVTTHYGIAPQNYEDRGKEYANAIASALYDLAWFLCLDGVLRPGVRSGVASPIVNATAYSLTGKGREWILAVTDDMKADLLQRLR